MPPRNRSMTGSYQNMPYFREMIQRKYDGTVSLEVQLECEQHVPELMMKIINRKIPPDQLLAEINDMKSKISKSVFE